MTPPDDLRSPSGSANSHPRVRVRSGREVTYNLIDLTTGVLFLDATPVACLASWPRAGHAGTGRAGGPDDDGGELAVGRAS
jgi:hypothetical protein